jgi:hypothetical protein
MKPFRDKFPNLGYLLRAYFHIDWMAEHHDEKDALRAFVSELNPEDIHRTIQELDVFIALKLKEPNLYRAVVDDLGSGYYPDTDYKDVNDWLHWVRDTLAKYAAEKSAEEKKTQG